MLKQKIERKGFLHRSNESIVDESAIKSLEQIEQESLSMNGDARRKRVLFKPRIKVININMNGDNNTAIFKS